jgi:hypothetical protein
LRWVFDKEPMSRSLVQPATWGMTLVAPGGIDSGWHKVASGVFKSAC